MNIILLEPNDFTSETEVVLYDRRFDHIRYILKAQCGDRLKVGQMNGACGQGEVINVTETSVGLRVALTAEPPPALPCTLLLALPRPIVLRRLLVHLITLGVKNIHLLQTQRVEKSYWQSPVLKPETITSLCRQGLEQAKDTIVPTVSLHKRFRPFIEDDLPSIMSQTIPLVAHPVATEKAASIQGEVTLAIGPEGGFVDHEKKTSNENKMFVSMLTMRKSSQEGQYFVAVFSKHN